jgi:hypothetical protein
MVQPTEANSDAAVNCRAVGTGPARIDELERQVAFLRRALGALGPVLQSFRTDDTTGLIGYSALPTGVPTFIEKSGTENQRVLTTDDQARYVREYIRQRRMRGDFFPLEFFADPVWDMMLDLYAAHYEGQQVSVSSLCIAAAVPSTTALRWIKTLTVCGWFVRTRDDHDGRRVYIDLSDEIRVKLDLYFDRIGA